MFNKRLAVNVAFFVNGFIYANWVSRLPRIQEAYAANDRTIGIVLLCLSLGAMSLSGTAEWQTPRIALTLVAVLFLVMTWLGYVYRPRGTHNA